MRRAILVAAIAGLALLAVAAVAQGPYNAWKINRFKLYAPGEVGAGDHSVLDAYQMQDSLLAPDGYKFTNIKISYWDIAGNYAAGAGGGNDFYVAFIADADSCYKPASYSTVAAAFFASSKSTVRYITEEPGNGARFIVHHAPDWEGFCEKVYFFSGASDTQVMVQVQAIATWLGTDNGVSGESFTSPER